MVFRNLLLEGIIMGYVFVIIIFIIFNKYSLVYNDLYICIYKFFKYLGFFFIDINERRYVNKCYN